MKTIKTLQNSLCFLTFIFYLIITFCSCSSSKNEEYSATLEKTMEQEVNTSSETTPEISPEETTMNPEEEAAQSRGKKETELYHSLEDINADREKKQVRGDELKNIDFTGCSVAAIDKYGVKIYEYLSGDSLNDFIDCITQADISAEEYGELPLFTGGIHTFLITLSTDEIVYIGEIEYKDLHLIIINGEGYSCEEECSTKLSNLYLEAFERFTEKAWNQ